MDSSATRSSDEITGDVRKGNVVRVNEYCAACSSVAWYQKVGHFRDEGKKYSELTESASAGCPFCSLIYACIRSFPEKFPSNLPQDSLTVHVVETFTDGNLLFIWLLDGTKFGDADVRQRDLCLVEMLMSLKISYVVNNGAVGIHEAAISQVEPLLSFEFPHDPPLPLRHFRSKVPVDPRSDECTSWLSAVASICDQHHANCQREQAPQLPTRVLDVGTDPSSTIRVCENQGFAQYVALSHCWGTNISATTRTFKSNIRSRRELGIEIETLPPTFRDAIFITRKLGLKYLWIDSLCIIQDDRLDWELESVNMGRYFENARHTIAALTSPGDEFGFLGPRDKTDFRTTKIEINGVSHTIFAEAYQEVVIDSFDRIPLLARAWCLQEIFFSKSLILFTNNEILVYCQTGTYRESEPVTRLCRMPEQLRRFTDLKHMFGASTADLSVWNWNTVVERFTTMKSTYASDRLPALSALAARFQQIHPEFGSYHAGIWRNDGLAALSWHVTEPDAETTVQGHGLSAPSWSWASVGAAVGYWYWKWYWKGSFRRGTPVSLKDGDEVHVIDISCSPLGANPYGEVKDGRVSLWCCLLPVRLVFDIESGWALHPPEYSPIMRQRLAESSNRDEEYHTEHGLFGPDLSNLYIMADCRLIERQLATERDLESIMSTTVARDTEEREEAQGNLNSNAWIIPLEELKRGLYFCLAVGLSLRVPGAYERVAAITLSYEGEISLQHVVSNGEFTAQEITLV